MNVCLALLETNVEILLWAVVGGVVCKVIFVSNPTTVLRLCCVVVGVVTTLFAYYILQSEQFRASEKMEKKDFETPSKSHENAFS